MARKACGLHGASQNFRRWPRARGRFYGFFDTIEEQGHYLSEDLSFCRRVRLAGAQVWALVDETVVHYGASEVAGQYLRALRMRGNVA
jgi:hypothetical protein